MDITQLEENAEQAAKLLTSMAHPKRLMVLCKLLQGECAVGELAQEVNLSQSALSQHLAKMRANSLVATRRSAQTIYYSLASAEVEAILTTLYDLYCAPEAEQNKSLC
ncbi:ArsR/SmtB family transcription factor [Polycladidibacter hongkongensis]|uniref:ArsR/SmtB family transcription factor n=1 Tax=Polycladidibacter hongkongensis TaxID=1647556 RepID=UPI00082CBDA6|nr:metalloregulator ArsR/SmtB family transcription factor [Pseudovibrio hongkongensis]